MNAILRNILAALAGLIVCMACLTALHGLNPILFDLAPIDPKASQEAMQAYVDSMPIGAQLILLPDYFISGFVGGYLATFLAAKPASMWPAIFIAAVYTAAGVMNLMAIPHPLWLAIGTMSCIASSPIVGYIARK
jgi:hypothetical protein